MSRVHGYTIDEWRDRCATILDEAAQLEPFAPRKVDDPWNADSLDSLEQHMLNTWATPEEIPDSVVQAYEAFLGEGLRRTFDGKWVFLPPEMLGVTGDAASTGLGIEYAASGATDVVSSMVPLAYQTRAGTWWSSAFAASQELARVGS
ncbi:hypothetical protein [Microbacterium sp. G2-8]|uniref:hypothetical protein n=1 Tax=Microbacterium sp. G2-8 TaxID=2842454 RepID=UPI001C8A3FEB|nr:hypothetical protein [Microbacterium sp. G2-8]